MYNRKPDQLIEEVKDEIFIDNPEFPILIQSEYECDIQSIYSRSSKTSNNVRKDDIKKEYLDISRDILADIEPKMQSREAHYQPGFRVCGDYQDEIKISFCIQDFNNLYTEGIINDESSFDE